jgi:prolyl-tRNA synthetase
MKYSKTVIQTIKNSKEHDSRNASLLFRGGFLSQAMAGVFVFLPMGLRVLKKIENIVREEMDKIGEEMLLPNLAPKKYWEQTGRYDTIDVLMKAVPANENSSSASKAEYVINPTHEDVITPTLAPFINSYKDLPVSYYQIQTKVRNEARPRSGVMRSREFRMKDLYSYHRSEADLLDFYNNDAVAAYTKVFERVGLGEDTVVALASGGDFTKEYSKEFQTKCEVGEDWIFSVKSKDLHYNREVAPSKAPEVEQDKEQKPMRVIETAGVTGMDQLEEFLGVAADHSMKTLIYETLEGDVIAVGIRGNYDVNEIKLEAVVNKGKLELASEETIKRLTGAEIGYAGIVNLPEEVTLYVDDSMENAVNFECGANKTDHHNLDVNWDVDVKKPETFYDLKVAQDGDIDPESGEKYDVYKASEVGNIFPLNTKFTEAAKMTFADENGKPQPVYMGSYGIGTSRLIGVIVEKFNDENGIIWPMAVAPYQVHMVTLGSGDSKEKAEKLYAELQDIGIEVLWDDREKVSAGSKFADADLIGCPIRIVVSDRSLQNGGVEMKMRSDKDSEIIAVDSLIETVQNKIKESK